MTKQFAEFMRKLRAAAGLSQTQVAKDLRLRSGQFISNWERAEAFPPLPMFRPLANAYGVDVEVIFSEYRKATEKLERRRIGI